jgi:putative transposase
MAEDNTTQVAEQAADTVKEKPKASKPKARPAKAAKPAKAAAAAAPAVEATAPKIKKRSPAERARLMALVAKQTRDGKNTLKNVLKDLDLSEQTYYNWKNSAPKPATAASSSPAAAQSDELKDLVALESENKRLRKELADKLRKENAELRKRLSQA